MKLFFSFFLLSMGSLFSYELGIITLFRNEAPYLKEWIEYHHMLGVDRFLLYNDRSDDDWKTVLEPYLQSQLVEVIEWHKDEATPLFPTWQIMAYKDGLARFFGNTRWAAFIDVDEFILPKKNGTILECLEEYYPKASGVYMCWRNFGTGGVYLKPGEPILTRLTACSDPLHSKNSAGKSLVKVEDVVASQVWSPHQLVLREGAQYYNGSGEPLRFQGSDLQVDPVHTSEIIQVNHYVMRDENFFQRVRLPKAISREYGQLPLLKEHYKSFNEDHDELMIEFLKTRHPEMFRSFWHGEVP